MEDLRRELHHRPLVLCAAALCVGLSAVTHPANLLFLLPLLWPQRPLEIALAFVLGLVLAPHPTPLLEGPTWVSGEATIVSVPVEETNSTTAFVELDGHRWQASFLPDTVVVRGERWQLKGLAKPLDERVDRLRLRGVEGSLYPDFFRRLSPAPWPWRLASGWRRSYVDFVRQTLPGDLGRWLTAFAFRTSDLDHKALEALAFTGTIHLAAASGLHVLALGGMLLALGRSLGAPRSASLAIAIVVLLLYAMATGLHLPTLRAVLAFGVGGSAYLLRREADGLSALALAILAYLPFDPPAVFEVGFQLSVTVVGFLVLWPRREVAPARTFLGWLTLEIRSLTSVALIATFASAPLIAVHLGTFSVLTLPANVLAVPPALGAIVLSFPLSLLHAGWAMAPVAGLIAIAKAIIEWVGGFSALIVTVPTFTSYLLVPFYALWAWFWRPRARVAA